MPGVIIKYSMNNFPPIHGTAITITTQYFCGTRRYCIKVYKLSLFIRDNTKADKYNRNNNRKDGVILRTII